MLKRSRQEQGRLQIRRTTLVRLIAAGLMVHGVFVAGTTSAMAGSVTLFASDSGWYNQYGDHTSTNTNWLAQNYAHQCGYYCWNTDFYHNFFAFSVSPLNGRIINSATFQTNSYGVSGTPSFSLWDVTTTPSTVLAGGTGLWQIYNDLGDGASYGSTTVTGSNSLVSVSLNAAAKQNINLAATSGQYFMMGGRIDTANTYAFSYSGNTGANVLSVNTTDPIWSAPTAVNLGSVLVGSQKTANFTISNAGPSGTTLINNAASSSSLSGSINSFGFDATNISLASAAVQSRAVDFKAVSRGSATSSQTFYSVNTGAYGYESKSISFQAIAVAPVVQISKSFPLNTSEPVAVRVGTTAVVALAQVKNAGDGNLSGAGETSNLRGSFLANSNGFSGNGSYSLVDGATQQFETLYAAVNRGIANGTGYVNTVNGSADGKNLNSSTAVQFSARGVGPEFNAGGQAAIDFGALTPGATGAGSLSITNSTTDRGYSNSLTGLTLLSANITGEYTSLFNLTSFAAGTMLAAGDLLNLNFTFKPTLGLASGHYGALFTLQTDESAAFGSTGSAYTFALNGNVIAAAVPEPETYALLLAGLGLIGTIGRRRSMKAAASA